jgi:hypothetical protein
MVGLLKRARANVSDQQYELKEKKAYLRRSHELHRLVPLSSFCDRVIVVYSTISVMRLLPECWWRGMTVDPIHIEITLLSCVLKAGQSEIYVKINSVEVRENAR